MAVDDAARKQSHRLAAAAREYREGPSHRKSQRPVTLRKRSLQRDSERPQGEGGGWRLVLPWPAAVAHLSTAGRGSTM